MFFHPRLRASSLIFGLIQKIFDFFKKFVNFQKSKMLGLFHLMGRREIKVVSFESLKFKHVKKHHKNQNFKFA